MNEPTDTDRVPGRRPPWLPLHFNAQPELDARTFRLPAEILSALDLIATALTEAGRQTGSVRKVSVNDIVTDYLGQVAETFWAEVGTRDAAAAGNVARVRVMEWLGGSTATSAPSGG